MGAAVLAPAGPFGLRWFLLLLLKPRCDGQGLPAQEAGDAWPDHQRWPWWGLLGREGENKAVQEQEEDLQTTQRAEGTKAHTFLLSVAFHFFLVLLVANNTKN